jgi:holo-[acyl-carrier protein] synthase
MIIALGIDFVEIERFRHWHTYRQKQLGRIFSQEEIDYCLSEPKKSAERFAVRFAAKEALFKALCQFYPEKQFKLLILAKNCEIIKTTVAPELSVDWNALNIPKLKVLVSLTHTRQTASAAVIIQEL